MSHPALRGVDDVPDVERIFLEPDQAGDYRRKCKLEELADIILDEPGIYKVHVNVCRRKEAVMAKTFIAHCCMIDEEELNLVYNFKTSLPPSFLVQQMIINDFRQYIMNYRIEDNDTVH